MKSYAGKISTQGPQEVKALNATKPTAKTKAIRGKDLRTGK